MEINVSKGIFKRSLALTMALLIALSGMWTGLASVSLAASGGSTVKVTAGNARSANDITPGETKTVTIISNQITYLRFTPTYSGEYKFYSNGSGDTLGYLFDADKNQLASNDDGLNDNNFLITYELQAGVTYYWGARYYNADNSGSYDVTLICIGCYHTNTRVLEGKEATCTEDGYNAGVWCDDCGSFASGHETITASHIDENSDGTCDRCNRGTPVDSGSCGSNSKYYLYSDGTLEIYGEGSINSSAFYNNDNIKSVIIGDGITSIGYSAFRFCENLESITIGKGVTSIDSYAFQGCTSLKKVYASDVESWLKISFYDSYSNPMYYATELYFGGELATEITIPDSITSIGYDAFLNCKSLEKVTIPDSVTSIGDNAFYNCTSLKKVYASDVESWLKISFNGYCNNPMYYATELYFGGELATEITIPDSVTSIGYEAFYNCKSLKKVTIPDSVTTISHYAFYNCKNLESITIPDSVTSIGYKAFYNCDSLKSVTIGKGATTIDDYAFYNCESLESITIPDSVTTIDGYAFYNCESLESVTIGKGVTTIGYDAFYNCTSLKKVYASDIESWLKISFNSYPSNPMYYATELYFGGELATEITIPDSITSIGYITFYNCKSLKKVTIPDSVTTIDGYAFYNCDSLESITIPDSVTSIGNSAFRYCENLESITIGKGVTSIGSYAFEYCTSLKKVYASDVESWLKISFNDYDSNPMNYATELYFGGELATEITIPDSVTEIKQYAFYDCESLESITITDSVKTIGYEAFRSCGSLESVTIGKGVTTIGIYAFGGTDITRVIIPDNVTSIASNSFDSDIVVYCNKGSYAAEWAESNSRQYTYIDGTDTESIHSGKFGKLTWTLDKRTGVLEIKGSGEMVSFSQAKGPWYNYRYFVKEVIIPDTVTAIGNYAFEGCYNLDSITIPDSVVSIGERAFTGCYGLESITIGSGVTSIGGRAFYDCSKLSEVYASDIESWLKISFYNSYSTPLLNGGELYFGGELVTDLVIPEGVKKINYITFYGCKSLKSVTIPDSVEIIDDGAFYNCTNLESVTIGNGTKTIGEYAFQYCANLKEVTLGNSVETISSQAFYNCTNLKDVTLGNSIENIYYQAFYNCESLEKITIPYSTKNINSSAFSGCTKLTEIYIFSPDCVYDTECGFNYNQTIYGFLGSTAETFANEIGAEFIDIETVHTHEYVTTVEKGYCSYKKCWCGKVVSVAHTDADYNASCDNCSTSVNDIEIDETVTLTASGSEALWLGFTPTVEGTYTLKVEGKFYEYTFRLYNESKSNYSSYYYGDVENNAKAVYLKPGQKYYFYVYPYFSEGASRDVKLSLTFKANHEHSYTSKVTKKATCTANGVTTYTCSCGDTYTSTIWASGHSYGSWYVYKSGSCSDGTIIKRDCSKCDAYDTMNFSASGKHTQETSVSRATDTHDGKIVTSCSVCGTKISSSTVYQISSVSLSATKYTYDGKAKTPSVTVKDSKGKTLKKDTDYTVTYASGRKNVGKYAVTVKFKGNYGGTEKLSFTIVPATPTGLGYTAASTTSVKLSWKAVSGATGYRVYMYNTSTKKYQSVAILEGKNALTVSSLKAGTSYKFKIKAFAEVGDDTFFWSSASSELVAYTKPATPTLKASSSKKGTASLSWTNVAGETGYQVYYATSKSGTYKSLGSYKVNVVKASKSKLTSGKTYYFKVRAYTKTSSGTIYSAWSSVKSVKVK